MGRKIKLNPDQVDTIRKSTKTQADLAEEFKVSRLTVHKVRTFKEAYKQHVFDLGEPVLNIHGNVVGVTPDNEIVTDFIPPSTS